MNAIFRQILFCGLVGGAGVALDAGLFLWLAKHRLERRLICANVISTSCGMVWTFAANWLLVFKPEHGEVATCMGRFLAVTCFSGWVLQSAVIRMGKSLVPSLLRRCQNRLLNVPFAHYFDVEGSQLRVVKAVAIGVGFLWNFFWYRNWVYAF